MATIIDICFLNLPINNSYENVYDSKETIINLARKQSGAPFKVVRFNLDGKNLGFNFNKKTKLTLKRTDFYTDISNLSFFNAFNYCVIQMKQGVTSQDVLYFINSIELNNSNDVVTFNLEFDEWHNNVDEFYSRNKDRKQLFERLTYDGFTKDTSDSNIYNYDGFIRDEPISARTYNSIQVVKKVLFKKIVVREEDSVYLYYGGGIKNNGNSAFTSLDNLNVYYIPLCVIHNDKIDTEIEDIEFDTGLKQKYIKKMHFFQGKIDYTGGITAEELLDTITVSSELTFYAPYRYSILSSKVVIDDEIVASDYVAVKLGAKPENVGDGVRTNFPIFGRNYNTDDIRVEYNISNNYSIYVDDNIFDSPKDSTIGRYNYYPFEYNSLTINGNELPLIPDYKRSKSYELYTGYNNFSPILKIKQGDIIYYPPISITPKSKTPVINDSYASFLISGVSSLDNQRLYSHISNAITTITGLGTTIAGAATSNPILALYGMTSLGSGITGFFKTEDSYDTTIKEKNNALDSVSTVADNGYSNLYIQDRIIKKFYSIIDTEQKEMVINFLDRFGISYNSFSDFNPQHHKFDFYKSSKIDILLTDNFSLNKIKEMFANGIRIWHLSNFSDNSSDNFIDCLNISYDKANIPMSIINGKEITL